MNRSDLSTIFASIAASYARRELDRTVYDRFMASQIGMRLAALDTKNKYALEFIAYSITALALLKTTNAGLVRKFVNNVVMDAPAEISKRAINGSPKIYPGQIKEFLAAMTDEEISTLIESVRAFSTTENKQSCDQPCSNADKPSALSEMADKIEDSRRRIRERRSKKL